MRIGVLAVAAATLVLLSGCGKKEPEAPSQVAQNTSPAATPTTPAPAPDPGELEKQKLVACTSTQVSLEPPSVEALASLQEQMRCVENFLTDYKTTQHWKQAYADRYKVMMDSMTVIKALGEPATSGGTSDLANAQRALMDREKLKKLKMENYNYVKRAVNEITTSITYSLFRQLKRSGVQMGNPKQDIEASNRMAKQTGVWGSTIDAESDNGEFVVSRWVTETSPMFKIEGYGSVSINTKIEDKYFDDNGAFSDNCKVYLGVTRERLSFDCAEYLSALKGSDVAKAMNAMISEDMSKKANRTN